MTDCLSSDQKVIYAVGAIVLCYHEVERYLKFLVPFTNSDDPSLSSILARHKKLSKKSLGEVIGQFFDSTTGDTEAFRTYFKSFVDKRNDLVHHFGDTYGKLIAAKQHDQVLAALKAQHQEAVAMFRILQEMAISLAEVMRDTTFQGTEQYDDLAALCTTARASLAS